MLFMFVSMFTYLSSSLFTSRFFVRSHVFVSRSSPPPLSPRSFFICNGNPFVASNEITAAVSAEIHAEAIRLAAHRVVCTQPSQVLGNRAQDVSHVSHTLGSQDGSETFLPRTPPSLCCRWCLTNQFLPGKQVCSLGSQLVTCGRW